MSNCRSALFRSASHLLVAAIFFTAALPQPSGAADELDEGKPKVTFAPVVEKKLKEVITKIAEAKQKNFEEGMKRELDDMAKAASLNPAGVAAMQAAAKQAVEHTLAEWTVKLDRLFRTGYVQQEPPMMLRMLDEVVTQSEFYKEQEVVPNFTRPWDQPVWLEAMKSTLSPEQDGLWAKAKKARDGEALERIAEFLRPSQDGIREQSRLILDRKVEEAVLALGLAPERKKELETLAKKVAENSVETWRANAEKALLHTEAKQRALLMSRGNFFGGGMDGQGFDVLAAWREGLDQLLRPEELAMLKAARERRRVQRAAVLARLMIALLDERVAFTEKQREQLQPIAEALVKEESALLAEPDSDSEDALAPQPLFAAAGKVKADALKPILDDSQLKRWMELSKMDADDAGSSRQTVEKPKGATQEKPKGRAPEPEDLENVLSDFMYEKVAVERKPLLAAMSLKAEDAARVAALADGPAARLQTAARGAAEMALMEWRPNFEQTVRSLVQDATAQNAKQRLTGIEDYQWQRGSSLTPGSSPLWELAVKTVLTDGQRAQWKKELDARASFLDQTIAATLLSEFDRKYALTKEQWQKVEPLIFQAVKEYSADINQMFTSFRQTAWYLQNYSMFLPFAAVPEKELKPILGKEKYEHWIGSSESSNASNYWQNVQQIHKQRVVNPK